MKFSCWYYLILFLVSNHVAAQKIVGKVIDVDNSIELSEVIVTNSEKNRVTQTDEKGSFILSNLGTYTFSKEGYFSKTVTFSSPEFRVIELKSRINNLNEVTITADNFRSKLKNMASAIAVISAKEIRTNSTVAIAPVLNTIPGVFMHHGTLTTNRITIRGIGTRNLYGTSKIRAYYEEIPLTNGSGESVIEDIELNALGKIEIFKGPSSSMYGAGLGGTIQLITDKGKFDKTFVRNSYTFGSYGLQKWLFQANLGNQVNSANIIYTNTNSDGYRENNNTNKKTLSVATNHFLNNKNRLTFIGNYIDLKAFIPSSVDETTYINNPKSSAFTWGTAKGFEDYKKGHFGLSWQHDYNSKTKQHTSVFNSFLTSLEVRPFNYLKEKTNAIGLRTKVLTNNKLFNKNFLWTIGGELFSDKNSYETYQNLYKDYPIGTGSVQGDLLSNFKETRTYFNLFFESKFELTAKTKFNFGLNLNKTSYNLKDRFNASNINYSGDYDFGTMLSPKFGLTTQISNNSTIYGTISHGFSPPTLEETLLPNNLINTNIKPESGWNFEVGSRGKFLNNTIDYDIAVYQMNVKNLLVAKRTSDDEFFGVNAGKTQYKGIEVSLGYNLPKLNTLNFRLYNSSSFNDYKFKDFIDLENDYSGKELPGVPKFTYNSAISFESDLGFYGNVNYRYVGKMPLRDDNTSYSTKYQLLNLKLGFRTHPNKKFNFNAFVGINNLLNEKYASMLLINASSFGNNAPRYFYPGKPINYYSGIHLKFTL